MDLIRIFLFSIIIVKAYNIDQAPLNSQSEMNKDTNEKEEKSKEWNSMSEEEKKGAVNEIINSRK
jgi:hypothetical protein